MRLTSEELLPFVVNLWESCPEGATTFYEAIIAEMRNAEKASVTGFDASSLSHPAGSSSRDTGSRWTPLERKARAGWLFKAFTRIQAAVSTDETAIYNTLIGELTQPVTSFRADLSCYGYP